MVFVDTWALHLHPWYLQWWFFLAANSVVVGGSAGWLVGRIFGSFICGLTVWWVTTISLAASLFAPLVVIFSLVGGLWGFWIFYAAVLWMRWRRNREADAWTG